MSRDTDGYPGGPGRAGLRELPGARLRVAGPGDAAALLRLKQRLDRETSFMLLEVGERVTSVAALTRDLENVARSGNSVVIVAEPAGDLAGLAGPEGDLAGYVELSGGAFRRSRTTAHVVLGVLAKAGGRGIGGGLLEEAKRWAARHDLHRLELTVMADNHRAFDLYLRSGFRVEGRRTECLIVDGRFADEVCMAAILPREPASETDPAR